MRFGLEAARLADGALEGKDSAACVGILAQDAPFNRRCLRVNGAHHTRFVNLGQRAPVVVEVQQDACEADTCRRKPWSKLKRTGVERCRRLARLFITRLLARAFR